MENTGVIARPNEMQAGETKEGKGIPDVKDE
jgi:hypothetical protein